MVKTFEDAVISSATKVFQLTMVGGTAHQKTHFRLPMATQDFHNLIETLQSTLNLTNPRFNRLIVLFILTAIVDNANE